MKERFIDRKFSAGSLDTINHANRIILDYKAKGLTLTLRQLYYRFVAAGLLPNKQSEYKRLGSIINDGRLAGLIDWDAIEDRTRNLKKPIAWESPSSIVNMVADQYQEDLWAQQLYRPEVWIEKEALIGVVEGVCEELRIPYFACRGYTSQSEAYVAGKRLRAWRRFEQKPIVFHLGDHDPSGMDMTRDNDQRLGMFAKSYVEVRRLALNMDQITLYNPPPNPAKDTNARFTGYEERYGDESWELDALEPEVISELIRDAVMTVLDIDQWKDATAKEQKNRSLLRGISDRWNDVADFIGEQPEDEE